MENNNLKYYMFDYDDNILILPTNIHLEHKVNNKWIKTQVSSAEFREIRS